MKEESQIIFVPHFINIDMMDMQTDVKPSSIIYTREEHNTKVCSWLKSGYYIKNKEGTSL